MANKEDIITSINTATDYHKAHTRLMSIYSQIYMR